MAERYGREGRVEVRSCDAEETTKTRRLKTPEGKVTRQITYRDLRISGAVDRIEPVEIVVNDSDRIIFGRCRCPFFEEHLMNQGPCEHMLALYQASWSIRTDRPTSIPGVDAELQTARKAPSRWEVDSGAESDDNDLTEEEV